MREVYVLPNATVAYWSPESLERVQEFAVRAVDEDELEQIGEAVVVASTGRSGR